MDEINKNISPKKHLRTHSLDMSMLQKNQMLKIDQYRFLIQKLNQWNQDQQENQNQQKYQSYYIKDQFYNMLFHYLNQIKDSDLYDSKPQQINEIYLWFIENYKRLFNTNCIDNNIAIQHFKINQDSSIKNSKLSTHHNSLNISNVKQQPYEQEIFSYMDNLWLKNRQQELSNIKKDREMIFTKQQLQHTYSKFKSKLLQRRDLSTMQVSIQQKPYIQQIQDQDFNQISQQFQYKNNKIKKIQDNNIKYIKNQFLLGQSQIQLQEEQIITNQKNNEKNNLQNQSTKKLVKSLDTKIQKQNLKPEIDQELSQDKKPMVFKLRKQFSMDYYHQKKATSSQKKELIQKAKQNQKIQIINFTKKLKSKFIDQSQFIQSQTFYKTFLSPKNSLKFKIRPSGSTLILNPFILDSKKKRKISQQKQ